MLGGINVSNLARQYQQQRPIQHDSVQSTPSRQKQKKNKTRFTKGEKGLFLLYMLGFIGLISVILVNQANIYSTEKDIHNLNDNIQSQSQVNDALHLQVIELSAPDRILHIASDQLGMTLDDNKVRVVQN